jgi:hypothetical protein
MQRHRPILCKAPAHHDESLFEQLPTNRELDPKMKHWPSNPDQIPDQEEREITLRRLSICEKIEHSFGKVKTMHALSDGTRGFSFHSIKYFYYLYKKKGWEGLWRYHSLHSKESDPYALFGITQREVKQWKNGLTKGIGSLAAWGKSKEFKRADVATALSRANRRWNKQSHRIVRAAASEIKAIRKANQQHKAELLSEIAWHQRQIKEKKAAYRKTV